MFYMLHFLYTLKVLTKITEWLSQQNRAGHTSQHICAVWPARSARIRRLTCFRILWLIFAVSGLILLNYILFSEYLTFLLKSWGGGCQVVMFWIFQGSKPLLPVKWNPCWIINIGKVPPLHKLAQEQILIVKMMFQYLWQYFPIIFEFLVTFV